MYGVVLWSDECDSKAVIWCEDHGTLAFYNAHDQSALDGLNLDPGDLIQFDLREHENMRVARNPMVITEKFSDGLADRLRAHINRHDVSEREPQARQKKAPNPTGEVLSLADYRKCKMSP
ncbi:MAG: hypothetical protein MK160_07235 [Rhodobacteraceae bacterium]|nr:hypothetical protein [Paracoccaceae bacterium]